MVLFPAPLGPPQDFLPGRVRWQRGELPRLPGLLVRPSLRGRPLPLDVLALGMERAAGHQRGDGEGHETEAHHSSLQVFLRRKAFEV